MSLKQHAFQAFGNGSLAIQFTTKRILVSMLLIVLGCAMLGAIFQRRIHDVMVFHLFLFGSGTLIWAGLFNPFRRWVLGAVVGTVLHVVLWIIAMSYFWDGR